MLVGKLFVKPEPLSVYASVNEVAVPSLSYTYTLFLSGAPTANLSPLSPHKETQCPKEVIPEAADIVWGVPQLVPL